MDSYDYVVVGGGSAGCVMAARLSEDADRSVLLIEAGASEGGFWVDTPAGIGKLFFDETHNWRFWTAPVPSLGGRSAYWPRGKGLGGSSAINGMVYMRGHPRDYDHWADLGNEGWSWNEVLPYFKKSEANENGADEFHNDGGPMSVSNPAVLHPSSDAFVEAAMRLGIPRLKDFNAPPYEGVGYRQFTIRRGRRETTYSAFLKPVRHRKNLTVTTNAQALRIIVENGATKALELLHDGEKRTVTVKRELVLSAGALGSPHLLMVSGIGNGANLRRQGVDVVHDLPGVGQNLQDHWFASFAMKVSPESSYNSSLLGLRKYFTGLRYLLTKGGYLALGASGVGAYVKSSPDRPQPDIQLAFGPMSFTFRQDGNPQIHDYAGATGSVVLVGPESVGDMQIASPDPLQSPIFNPNYLSHPEDIRRSLVGLRLMRKILATEPLASRMIAEMAPGADALSDEQLLDHLKLTGSSGWHPCGTCKMGSDDLAVVDARLRLRGLRGLRVVDASIMPRIISGNTNAPTIMIAEKGADMIRQDAGT